MKNNDGKVWVCPNKCKMNYVSVEQQEITYYNDGHCKLDDVDCEDIERGETIDSYSVYMMFSCPVCGQVLEIRK